MLIRGNMSKSFLLGGAINRIFLEYIKHIYDFVPLFPEQWIGSV